MMPSQNTGSSPVAADARIAALCSGGLDSAVMLVELTRDFPEVFPLYVRCGLAWEAEEIAALGRFLDQVRNPAVRPVQMLEFPMKDVYGGAWYASGVGVPGYDEADEKWEIPGRNVSLAAKAAIWCAVHDVAHIALGVLASNPFPDATARFFAAMEQALSLGLGKAICLHRPFSSMHKLDVVRLGRHLPLELTLSCASPVEGKHCGRCGKCRERIDAFICAGIPDPTFYAAGAGVFSRRNLVDPA